MPLSGTHWPVLLLSVTLREMPTSGIYDFLIVGAGLFGATCAYELSARGQNCLVIEKRRHIGGNCFTEPRDGITIHRYGPHIFHTSDERIWTWIRQFATFNHYRHRAKVNLHGKIYSFPLNLATFNELWGITTPNDAKAHLDSIAIPNIDVSDLEGWALSKVGSEIYHKFIKGYTSKQWGCDPSCLPASLIKRLPIRLSYDDSYFVDPYQGIPIGGYTPIIEKLFARCRVLTNVDYLRSKSELDRSARHVIYTGPLDAFHEFRFGKLDYRSLCFSHELLETNDFQGIAQMNYPSQSIPYTRIIEHKHFEFGCQPVTWISKEYPASLKDGEGEMYPIPDKDNMERANKYKERSKDSYFRKYSFGGRLAEYRYYDMHQAIGSALHLVKMLVSNQSLT